MPPYLYSLRPLDRQAEDDERHAGDDPILTYPGHSQAKLSTCYLSISVSTDLDKQLESPPESPAEPPTRRRSAAKILQQIVQSNHAGQHLPARRQYMLTGDELYIPHDARPDDRTDGDGAAD